MSRALSAGFVAGVTLIALALLGSASGEDVTNFGKTGAGNGVWPVLNSTAGDQDSSVTASNAGSFAINNPEFGPNLVWMAPATLIAGFAAGYGMRSLVSSRRHRRARRSRFGSLPSDRLQLEADNSHISIVPRDDSGDLQSPRHPRSAARPRQSS